MNVFLKQLLVILIGNILISTIVCDDSLELTCTSDDDCKSYQNKFVSSECNVDACVCLDRRDGSWLECSPKASYIENQFVHQKTCTGFNTELRNGVCRVRAVFLSRYCEEDIQCQRNDLNAICYKNICTCKDHFMEIDDQCRSMTKIEHCSKSEDCPENAECLKSKCLCKKEFISSADHKKCLPYRAYNQTCDEDSQCSMTIGFNAACIDNVCKCNRKYDVFQKDKDVFCVRKGVMGDPCMTNTDCFNEEFLLYCVDNVCSCKVILDGESLMPVEICQRRSPKAMKQASNSGAASTKVFKMFSVIVVFSVLFAL